MPGDWFAIALLLAGVAVGARLVLRGRSGWLGCVGLGTVASMILSMVIVGLSAMVDPLPGNEPAPIWWAPLLGAIPLLFAVGLAALVAPAGQRRLGAMWSGRLIAIGCGWFYALVAVAVLVSLVVPLWTSLVR